MEWPYNCRFTGMKQTFTLLATLLLCSVFSQAQDISKLICPFENGLGSPTKEAYTWNPADKKLILVSTTDTIIRSVIDATVLTVMPSDEGDYQIVIHYDDYYFWYFGVKKPLVNRGQKLKAGQPLATYTTGKEVEFRMFKDEEALDPRGLLDCKVK